MLRHVSRRCRHQAGQGVPCRRSPALAARSCWAGLTALACQGDEWPPAACVAWRQGSPQMPPPVWSCQALPVLSLCACWTTATCTSQGTKVSMCGQQTLQAAVRRQLAAQQKAGGFCLDLYATQKNKIRGMTGAQRWHRGMQAGLQSLLLQPTMPWHQQTNSPSDVSDQEASCLQGTVRQLAIPGQSVPPPPPPPPASPTTYFTTGHSFKQSLTWAPQRPRPLQPPWPGGPPCPLMSWRQPA